MLKRPEIHGNTIVVPSDPNLIGEIDEFVESRLRARKVDDSIIADIAICATEIANNGIIHGNKANPEKTVKLDMNFTGEEVTITITDQGQYFNPDDVENPLDEKNLLREVGRGIFIVRSLMDRLEITPAEGGGTMVTLVKKIT
ncbi:MAG: ATP-binding protein [Candidatus Zixiibacteriota bacterium]